MLNKYFVEHKNIPKDDYDNPIKPFLIQDMVEAIPQLSQKIEIVPSVNSIDPMTGEVNIDWNMFVLGNQRLYVGNSTHTNLSELKESSNSPNMKIDYKSNTTPNKIIKFVSHVLSNSKNGKINMNIDGGNIMPSGMNINMNYGGSQGFERNKFL